MKKYIVYFLAITTICFFYFLNKKSEDDLKNCMESCVCVFNPDLCSSGSGVIVRSIEQDGAFCNVVISSAHIFENDYRLHKSNYIIKLPVINKRKILFYQEKPCYIHSINAEQDLSILIFYTSEKIKCAKIDFDKKVDIDDEIMKMGYGLEDDLRIDYGNITQLNAKLYQYNNLYRTSAFAIFGDSGGPVYLDFKLIAITQGIKNYKGSPIYNISYICPIGSLKLWNQKEDIDFCYENKELPKIPKYLIELKNWQYIK